MNGQNPKVNYFFEQPSPWQAFFAQMRRMVLDCGLQEELKWGQACYTLNGSNIVLIHGFKAYCAFLFFKGALLKDEYHILIRQTEQVQAARHLRFTDLQQILEQESIIKQYIFEAIAIEKAGLKVALKTTKDYQVPEEFQWQLDQNSTLKKAFEALTPGRQRAYLFHFAQPKQAKTRASRIEKWLPQILEGKGMND